MSTDSVYTPSGLAAQRPGRAGLPHGGGSDSAGLRRLRVLLEEEGVALRGCS